MMPCDPPVLVTDPDNAPTEEIAYERIEVAKAYVCERTKREGLVKFLRGRDGD